MSVEIKLISLKFTFELIGGASRRSPHFVCQFQVRQKFLLRVGLKSRRFVFAEAALVHELAGVFVGLQNVLPQILLSNKKLLKILENI